jgi:hypothetical protein
MTSHANAIIETTMINTSSSSSTYAVVTWRTNEARMRRRDVAGGDRLRSHCLHRCDVAPVHLRGLHCVVYEVQRKASDPESKTEVGSPRVVAFPGLPRIRTCGIPASGSSRHGIRCATREDSRRRQRIPLQ